MNGADMTDRELLELAAKAAGIEYQRNDDGEVIEYFGGGLQLPFAGGKWSPLTDDGDALRLAVKIGLEVKIWLDDGLTGAGKAGSDIGLFGYHAESDPYAATRRAIVRAAAEIGKAMP